MPAEETPGTVNAPSKESPKIFYSALDGLRGLAAISVVFFHLANWTGTQNWFPRGDLAVDFFFCLSGFVLAHAYAGRLGKTLSYSDFAITRVIRLYPMLFASVLLAASYFLGKSLLTSETIPLTDLFAATATAILVLPYFGSSVPLSGLYEAFPINGPLWSLFYEFFISFAWVTAFAFLTFRRTIAVAFVCGAILLFGGLLHTDLLLGDRTSDFFWGFPRVGVSFTLGLIVYHIHKQQWLRFKIPFLVISLGLIVPLMVPRDASWFAVIFDAVFIYALSPFIVLIGAEVRQSGRWKQISEFGGELSYPIYVLHFPFFAWVNGGQQMLGVSLPVPAAIALYFVVILIGSWVALVWFDRPVRRLLKKLHKTQKWPEAIHLSFDRLFRSK